MTSNPQHEDEHRTEPVGPLDNAAAGRQVAHVTGMTQDSARTFAAFHLGLYSQRSAFPRAA